MTIDRPTHSQFSALRTLWHEAFGDGNEFLDMFWETAFSQDRCRCVIQGDTPVAALYWFDCYFEGKKIAYLYAIATAKSARGKGLCTTLMQNTHKHLSSIGYSAAILVPSEPSLFSFYERLGYRTSSYVTDFFAEASDIGTEIRQITKEEYATLRRTVLPTGSVIQEDENLDFLAAQYKFYHADEVLLAASIEQDKLYCAEFLGNKARAPYILRTLGISSANFRTTGLDRAFAMFIPFENDILTPPEYFGLAFD